MTPKAGNNRSRGPAPTSVSNIRVTPSGAERFSSINAAGSTEDFDFDWSSQMRSITFVSCADSVLGSLTVRPVDLALANPIMELGGAEAEFVCGGGNRFASSDKSCGPESELRRIRSWHESEPLSEARSSLRHRQETLGQVKMPTLALVIASSSI